MKTFFKYLTMFIMVGIITILSIILNILPNALYYFNTINIIIGIMAVIILIEIMFDYHSLEIKDTSNQEFPYFDNHE